MRESSVVDMVWFRAKEKEFSSGKGAEANTKSVERDID